MFILYTVGPEAFTVHTRRAGVYNSILYNIKRFPLLIIRSHIAENGVVYRCWLERVFAVIRVYANMAMVYSLCKSIPIKMLRSKTTNN